MLERKGQTYMLEQLVAAAGAARSLAAPLAAHLGAVDELTGRTDDPAMVVDVSKAPWLVNHRFGDTILAHRLVVRGKCELQRPLEPIAELLRNSLGRWLNGKRNNNGGRPTQDEDDDGGYQAALGVSI